MKIKLAIVCGILIWLLTYLITESLNPIFTDSFPYVNILVPIVMIIVTGFFGIIYIRNIESNEVIEGIAAGLIFILVDIILDYAFIVLPQRVTLIIIPSYYFHLTSMIVLTLLITTFLGYLAQMSIDLK